MEDRHKTKRQKVAHAQFDVILRAMFQPNLTWDNLPTVCVDIIISKLSIRELFITTSLNKHWHSHRANALNQRKEMKIKVLLSEVDYSFIADNVSIPELYLIKFLKSVQDYNNPQNELRLSSLTADTMRQIQDYFPNIENMTFELCYPEAALFNIDYFQRFLKSQNKLVKLSIFHYFENSDQDSIVSQLRTLWQAIDAAPKLERLSFFFFHTIKELFTGTIPGDITFNVTSLSRLKVFHYATMSAFGTEAIVPALERLAPQNQQLELVELKDPLTDSAAGRLAQIGGCFPYAVRRLSVCPIRPITFTNLCQHFPCVYILDVILNFTENEVQNGAEPENEVINGAGPENEVVNDAEPENGALEAAEVGVENGVRVEPENEDKLDYIKVVDILSEFAPAKLKILQLFNPKLGQMNQASATVSTINFVKFFFKTQGLPYNISDLREPAKIDEHHRHYFLGQIADCIPRTYPDAENIHLDFHDLIECTVAECIDYYKCASTLVSPLVVLFARSQKLKGLRLAISGGHHTVDRNNVDEIHQMAHSSKPYVERFNCEDWEIFRKQKLVRLTETLNDLVHDFSALYEDQLEPLKQLSDCFISYLHYKYWSSAFWFEEEVKFLPPDEMAELDQEMLNWFLTQLMPDLVVRYWPSFNEEYFVGLNSYLAYTLKVEVRKLPNSEVSPLVDGLLPEHYAWFNQNIENCEYRSQNLGQVYKYWHQVQMYQFIPGYNLCTCGQQLPDQSSSTSPSNLFFNSHHQRDCPLFNALPNIIAPMEDSKRREGNSTFENPIDENFNESVDQNGK